MNVQISNSRNKNEVNNINSDIDISISEFSYPIIQTQAQPNNYEIKSPERIQKSIRNDNFYYSIDNEYNAANLKTRHPIQKQISYHKNFKEASKDPN